MKDAKNRENFTVGRVFVPGGLPTVTYNPRDDLQLEQKVRDYLDERHKVLSLSGATKTGKTVLLKSIVPEAVWISGGEVPDAQGFWALVADRLAVTTEIQSGATDEETTERTTSGEGSAFLAKVKREGREAQKLSRTDTRGRTRPVESAARESLASNLQPLVIDDFHYIDPEVQLQIVRGLKNLVFDGLPVIVAAVPHRAYDAVRVEKEMTGRVEQLQIPFWKEEELVGIALAGFDALNVEDRDGIAERLAEESFKSPHLMQEFCREVCKANGVRSTCDNTERLTPVDWEPFFRARASAASKSAFDLLARGPRARTDRKERQLKDGRTTDIYGAVLAAIAATGPLTQLTYEELRAALRDVLYDPPAKHEVTRVLEQMSRIAREQIEGEPVIDYDVELSTLFIADPFFAYFLRWGERYEDY